MEKIVVGLSGGVDSFVSALLLQRQGYEVVGVNLSMWGENDPSEMQALCRKLGIEALCWDGRGLFREAVVQPFVAGYVCGETPSPCCVCNRYVKWQLLAEAADSLGIKRIATGHYVRITESDGKYYFRKGVDAVKDQSYFLWGVPQEILCRAITPLGGMTKAEVKAYAAAHGFEEMAGKPESMGICFLQGGDYRDFIIAWGEQRDGLQRPGNIVDAGGKVVGRHDGILNYTIGQKRGMPLVEGAPLYVAEIDSLTHTIRADVKSGLYRMSLEVDRVSAVRYEDLFRGDVTIKIRGLGLNPEGYIRVQENPDRSLHVRLAAAAWAVAPGQPVAFYRGDLLLGGGYVKK